MQLSKRKPEGKADHLPGRHRTESTAVSARPLSPITATLRQETQPLLLLALLPGGSGICEISAKSISEFHRFRMPRRCPAPTTATTFDALRITTQSLARTV